MTYSEKIVKLRKANGYSQETFAKSVGVSRQAVYKWESGQSYPEAEKLIEIKKLFGISIDDLLDDTYVIELEKKPAKKKKEEEKPAEIAEQKQEEPAEEKKPEAKAEHKTAPVAPQKKQQTGLFGIVNGIFGRKKK